MNINFKKLEVVKRSMTRGTEAIEILLNCFEGLSDEEEKTLSDWEAFQRAAVLTDGMDDMTETAFVDFTMQLYEMYDKHRDAILAQLGRMFIAYHAASEEDENDF